MVKRSRLNPMLPLAALGIAALLGGCVAYPAYPAYGYGYGPATPYYGGGYVALGGGWHGHDGGWHDHDGWRR